MVLLECSAYKAHSGDQLVLHVSSIGMTRETKVMTGKVIWFNKVKGYGFIARSGGPDVFVHYTAIVAKGYRALTEGDVVEFEVVQGPRGPQAANVVLRLSTPSGDT